MNFMTIQHAVAAQFEKLSKGDLFRTGAEKDELWTTYLGSFPEGSNPIYKERTGHDCNCCKQYIRAVGNVVGIVNGKLESIWDIQVDEPNYQAVANAMSKFVKDHAIVDTFLHYERTAGTVKSFQETISGVQTWNHFFVNIPQKFVKPNADIATALSLTRSTHDVFLRALIEIPMDAVNTVLELIAQNSIYRGEEHKFAVIEFKKQLVAFDKAEDKETFVWASLSEVKGSVSNIRNSVIGTLMTDLAEGKDLTDAVGSYESKVAPTNYKRPTALVTKAMIEKAKNTIEEMGLTSALERRYANISDITINNVLFADRSSKPKMQSSVFDGIAATVATKKPKALDKVEEVQIEKFLSDILPKAETIEVMLENKHTNNLVSLIAPFDPTAKPLFKWNNNFSWSYNGDVADSIKGRVKQAGGNVTGDLCCRLAWFNYDDLDFYMLEPNGSTIYFGNRNSYSGSLDVDMNAAGRHESRAPVENIVYPSKHNMQEGVYKLSVNNYSKQETKDEGFEVEMDFMGTVYKFSYAQAVKNKSTIVVVEFKYTHKDGIEFIKALPPTQSVKTIWNLPTQSFRKVSALMLSPNYWDGFNTGNKHYFFMLDGCLNDGTARGFYNEFLREELTPHRKVIEVVGSKMQTANSEKQLSGLGFSTTQRNELLVKVTGSFSRVIKVVF